MFPDEKAEKLFTLRRFVFGSPLSEFAGGDIAAYLIAGRSIFLIDVNAKGRFFAVKSAANVREGKEGAAAGY